MIRSALPLAVVAALGLSACGSSPDRDPAPRAAAPAAPAGQPLPYRAGSGVVQSVTPAPRAASAGASAAPVTTTRGEPVTSAGATTAAGQYQRLAIRMDDGRVQYVDMAGPDIPPVGTRIQLTPDHQIIRQ
jgi:hypothetical protein